uniref:Uncharacterized protein n=1 Tax=Tetradesmus obliquus TaxID=3088 RepID=A0A383WGI8_TETOB|eukprot:jgi/Sobl393_1/1940/SZX76373.1
MQEVMEQSLNASAAQTNNGSSSSNSSRLLRALEPAIMSLQVRSCIPGEATAAPDACQECLEGSFSLEPSNATCDAAPDGALAPGGTAIIPLEGYWSSDPQSNQVHRCPNPAACQGNRSILLDSCSSPAGPQWPCTGPGQFSALQCSSGYSGNLCAVCKLGFGATKPFTCRHCLPKPTLLGLYIVAAVVMLLLIKLLCMFTMAEASRSNQGIGSSSNSSIGPTASLPRSQQGAAAAEASAAPGTCTARSNSSSSSSSSSSDNGTEPSMLLRALVLFMQYQIIVASVGVSWPAPLEVPLQGLAWIWSGASPETLAPDCLLRDGSDSGSSLAVKRVMFHVLAPLAMLCVLVAVEVLTAFAAAAGRARSKALLLLPGRLLATALVVLFFFLPSLSRTAFSLFACIRIDAPAAAPYAAAAVGWFSVLDTNAACFGDGWHKKQLQLRQGLKALLLWVGVKCGCAQMPAAKSSATAESAPVSSDTGRAITART